MAVSYERGTTVLILPTSLAPGKNVSGSVHLSGSVNRRAGGLEKWVCKPIQVIPSPLDSRPTPRGGHAPYAESWVALNGVLGGSNWSLEQLSMGS